MAIALSNFYRGDTKVYTLTVTTASGAVQDISAWEIWITLKADPTAADSTAVINEKFIVPTDANSALGIVTITLTSAMTAVPVGSYKYDVQRVIPGVPPDVETIGSGTVKVLQDITITTA